MFSKGPKKNTKAHKSIPHNIPGKIFGSYSVNIFISYGIYNTQYIHTNLNKTPKRRIQTF